MEGSQRASTPMLHSKTPELTSASEGTIQNSGKKKFMWFGKNKHERKDEQSNS